MAGEPDQASKPKCVLSRPPHGPRKQAPQMGISWYTTGQVPSARWVTGQQRLGGQRFVRNGTAPLADRGARGSHRRTPGRGRVVRPDRGVRAGPGQGRARPPGRPSPRTRPQVQPETVVSVTPASHSQGVNGASPGPGRLLGPAGRRLPAAHDHTGRYKAAGSGQGHTLQFVPAQGFPATHVRVPSRPGPGRPVPSGGQLAAQVGRHFQTGYLSPRPRLEAARPSSATCR